MPDVAVVDAGPDAEQDPDVYPAKHQPIAQLDNFGGPVLDHVQVVTVTFNDGPDGGPEPLATLFNKFDDTIVADAWWAQAMAGYGVMTGTSGGHVALPDTVSNTNITDDQLKQYLQAQVTAGALPTPTTETLFALYFPKTTSITLQGAGSCSAFLGYHNSASIQLEGGTVEAAYAVLPRCDYGQGPTQLVKDTLVTASHEFAEAASDPHPEVNPAYYLQSNDAWVLEGDGQGGEVGDLCDFIGALRYDDNGYTVQRIWSNQAAAQSKDPCQPTDDFSPPRFYYGAAVRTEHVTVGVNGQPSDGYLLVKRGKTASFQVNVFSEAPLPSDLHFYVGVPKRGATDPSDMAALSDGVTATLSIMTGHNGNAAVLAVTVASTAAMIDDFFVVRSVLASDDFHDWPVILRVQ